MATGSSPEWLNQNSTRAYPLGENCSRMDLTNSVQIPNSLIVAAQINSVAAYASGIFYVSSITSVPDQVTIALGWQPPQGGARDIASVSVPVATHADNASYPFQGTGQDASVIGCLTIGNLYETLNQIPGCVQFASGSAYFEVSALLVSPMAPLSVQLYNGSALVQTFPGILNLRAGANVSLTLINNDTIRVDVAIGSNVMTPDLCANGGVASLPSYIRTINNIGPDANLNFEINGSECIEVELGANSLTLTDLCSQSCCGCAELASLMAGLDSLETEIAQLSVQIAAGAAAQAQMIANLVSSLV